MDNRNQAGKYIFFILIQKSNILFHRVVLSTVIFNRLCRRNDQIIN